jgi:hypothetical protein
LHLTGLHGEIHNRADGDDEHHGEEAGKAKPQGGMPVGGPITTLDLAIHQFDALDIRGGGILQTLELLCNACGLKESRTLCMRLHPVPPYLDSRDGATTLRQSPLGLPSGGVHPSAGDPQRYCGRGSRG